MSDDRELKAAIDANDLARVKALMTANPALHRAAMGYAGNGPLTWVAECRVPWEPPGPVRLAMAQWMIENGSDVHQGGDGPLMRASLAERVPMMELLVAHGADVNALWNGNYPIIFGPCETVDPIPLQWLLDHGANPNTPETTALDYVIGSYLRSPKLAVCIDILLKAGCGTKYDIPPVLDLLRGHMEEFARRLNADPTLIDRRFPELDFGVTGTRMLTLNGATLLHAAAEYGNLDAATLLLDRGADVNATARPGGQTAIFHAATQSNDGGLAMVKLLLVRGTDLSIRAKLPGHYERPGEVVECTAEGYATKFPGDPDFQETVALLRERRSP